MGVLAAMRGFAAITGTQKGVGGWASLVPALPWRVKAGHPDSILLIEILDDQCPIELAMRCPPIRFQLIIGDKGIQVV